MISPYDKFSELDLHSEVEELDDAVMELGTALATNDDDLIDVRIDSALMQVDEVKTGLLSIKRHYEAAQPGTGKAGA